jgi:hypothetical protein
MPLPFSRTAPESARSYPHIRCRPRCVLAGPLARLRRGGPEITAEAGPPYTVTHGEWGRVRGPARRKRERGAEHHPGRRAGLREQGYGRMVNIGTNLLQNPVVPYHDYTGLVMD